MLQSPSEFNAMMVKTYTSKCDFDNGLFSEPLAIMNLLWEYGQVGNKKKEWCWKNGVSFPRISRMSSNATNILQRVATYLNISVGKLELEAPPKDMPEAKITLLRIIQSWVFHDTIIECKIKQEIPCEQSVKLLPKSSQIDGKILGALFAKNRHSFSLMNPKEIEKRVKCRINWDTDYERQMENRALSYALEKNVDIISLRIGKSFSLYFAGSVVQSTNFSHIITLAKACLQGPETLVASAIKRRTKRGILERACGKWSFSNGSQASEKLWFHRYATTDFDASKKTIAELIAQMSQFVEMNVSFCALSINLSTTPNQSKRPVHLEVVSRGSTVTEPAIPDLRDFIQALGEMDMKVKRKSCKTTIGFGPLAKDRKAATGIDRGCGVRPNLLVNTPEAFRLLSVLATRRRSHSIIFELDLDDETDDVSESDKIAEIFPDPKTTKLSFRWTRFNSVNDRVYVEESSQVASAMPVGWTGTMYCCCANALDIKGGAMKAECLTLLPLSRLFFILCKVTFGLLHSDPLDKKTIRKCLIWISQDTNTVVPDDAAERLQAAAQFHDSFEAGEELVCLPSSVEMLLEIFDGVGGMAAKPWKTLMQDPFIEKSVKQRKA